MNFSFSYKGCYLEYKPFFDVFVPAMQSAGHRVGIITGEREKDVYSGEDIKSKILNDLPFTPDFVHMWAQTESIANADLWIAQKMDLEDSYVHFDENAANIKRYTDRWVFKSLNSANPNKF